LEIKRAKSFEPKRTGYPEKKTKRLWPLEREKKKRQSFKKDEKNTGIGSSEGTDAATSQLLGKCSLGHMAKEGKGRRKRDICKKESAIHD